MDMLAAVSHQASLETFRTLVRTLGVEQIRRECPKTILCDVLSTVTNKATRIFLYGVFDDEKFLAPMFSCIEGIDTQNVTELADILARATGPQPFETLQSLFSLHFFGSGGWKPQCFRFQESVFGTLVKQNTEAFLVGCMLFQKGHFPVSLEPGDPDYALRYGTAFFCGRFECLVSAPPKKFERNLLFYIQHIIKKTFANDSRRNGEVEKEYYMMFEWRRTSGAVDEGNSSDDAGCSLVDDDSKYEFSIKGLNHFARWIATDRSRNNVVDTGIHAKIMKIPLEQSFFDDPSFPLLQLPTSLLMELVMFEFPREFMNSVYYDKWVDHAIEIIVERGDFKSRYLTRAIRKACHYTEIEYMPKTVLKLLKSSIPVEGNQMLQHLCLKYEANERSLRYLPYSVRIANLQYTTPTGAGLIHDICTNLLKFKLDDGAETVSRRSEFFFQNGWFPPKLEPRYVMIPHRRLLDHNFRMPKKACLPLALLLDPRQILHTAYVLYSLVEFEKDVLRALKMKFVHIALLARLDFQCRLPKDLLHLIFSFVPNIPEIQNTFCHRELCLFYHAKKQFRI